MQLMPQRGRARRTLDMHSRLRFVLGTAINLFGLAVLAGQALIR
jgi:hypothetical protein